MMKKRHNNHLLRIKLVINIEMNKIVLLNNKINKKVR